MLLESKQVTVPHSMIGAQRGADRSARRAKAGKLRVLGLLSATDRISLQRPLGLNRIALGHHPDTRTEEGSRVDGLAEDLNRIGYPMSAFLLS